MDKDLKLRIRTVLVYAPIPLLMLILSNITTWILLVFMGSLALYEWRFVQVQSRKETLDSAIMRVMIFGFIAVMLIALVSFWLAGFTIIIAAWLLSLSTMNKERRINILGFFLITLVALAFYWVRQVEGGLGILVFFLILTAFDDTGAYLVGRAIGRTPLAPEISPNKTVEGAIGGWVATILIGLLLANWLAPIFGRLPIFFEILIYWILAMAGQFGDLSESAFKRKYQVKDSSQLLPGHGGILDRFDAFSLILLMGAALMLATGFL